METNISKLLRKKDEFKDFLETTSLKSIQKDLLNLRFDDLMTSINVDDLMRHECGYLRGVLMGYLYGNVIDCGEYEYIKKMLLGVLYKEDN